MITFDAIDQMQSIFLVPNSALTTVQMESAARSVVDKLSGADYAGVEARFNQLMKTNLNQGQLQAVWQQTLQTFGAFGQIQVAAASHSKLRLRAKLQACQSQVPAVCPNNSRSPEEAWP